MQNMNTLKQDESGTVSDMPVCRRLRDIGLIIGTKVTCIQKSPLGDPVAYLIRGAVIALRSEDSSRVLIDISEVYDIER